MFSYHSFYMYFNYNSDITCFSWGHPLNGKGFLRDLGGFRRHKKTRKLLIYNNFRSVRETGLEELGKRPYRALSSLFVKNLISYETSLYIPSRSDTYHLNLFSFWLGHRLGHNPQIRLLRYAVSMFSPIHKTDTERRTKP